MKKNMFRAVAVLCTCITLVLAAGTAAFADVAFEPEVEFARDTGAVIQGAALAVVPIVISVILIMLFWRKKGKAGLRQTDGTTGEDIAENAVSADAVENAAGANTADDAAAGADTAGNAAVAEPSDDAADNMKEE